jgi:hypothetical protein
MKKMITILLAVVTATLLYGQGYVTISFADAQKRMEKEPVSKNYFNTCLDTIDSTLMTKDNFSQPYVYPGTSRGYNLHGYSWQNQDPTIKFWDGFEPGIYFVEYELDTPVKFSLTKDNSKVEYTKTKLVWFHFHDVYIDTPVGKFQLWAINYDGYALGNGYAQHLLREGVQPDNIFRVVDVAINTNPQSENFLKLEATKK